MTAASPDGGDAACCAGVVQRAVAQLPTRPCVAISTRVAEFCSACSDTPEFDNFRARRPTVHRLSIRKMDNSLVRPVLAHHKHHHLPGLLSAPGRVRTCDLRFRNRAKTSPGCTNECCPVPSSRHDAKRGVHLVLEFPARADASVTTALPRRPPKWPVSDPSVSASEGLSRRSASGSLVGLAGA